MWCTINSGIEILRGVSAVDLGFLELRFDISHQNLAEFLGVIISVVGHVILGYPGWTRMISLTVTMRLFY